VRSFQVTVVGGGPAGISAAMAAAESGAQTLLVDEQAALGGQLRWRLSTVGIPHANLAARPGPTLARDLAAWLGTRGDRLEIATGTVAWGLFEDNVLGLSTEENAYQVQSDAIVLATGSTDVALPFPGWTLPGVMMARALQIFMHVHRVLPARRWVVLGDSDPADEVAHDIEAAGGEVVRRWPDAGTIEAGGNAQVERVVCDGEAVEADGVALALGRQPDAELAFQAGAAAAFDWTLGGHVPILDADLRTSDSELLVCGDASGICTIEEAALEGRLAGLVAAGASADHVESARDEYADQVNQDRLAAMERARARS
jgi:pyruvate/2-oxoglutarate dehydrogenase complex dihydrolipoamide dehydrogenase (E3) component